MPSASFRLGSAPARKSLAIAAALSLSRFTHQSLGAGARLSLLAHAAVLQHRLSASNRHARRLPEGARCGARLAEPGRSPEIADEREQDTDEGWKSGMAAGSSNLRFYFNQTTLKTLL
ncbi:hypothetical protein [Kerstersia sp.]|uniref:hypothetical protein n=1 Tax=Kerstersia sp. TaxID=1930783 RepID=UPI003F90B2A4